MNKNICFFIIIAMITVLTACSNTTNTPSVSTQTENQEVVVIEQMPPPFKENTGGFLSRYYNKYNERFSTISGDLLDLVGEEKATAWINEFELYNRPRDEGNLYFFITEMEIPKEKIPETVYSLGDYMSESDIDVIYSGDIQKINETFISPYCILANGEIITPEWLYTHSKEEYATAGITSEQLKEKSEMYTLIQFTDEAKVAFGNKLSSFIGEEISLVDEADISPVTTPFSPENVKTTAPPSEEYLREHPVVTTHGT